MNGDALLHWWDQNRADLPWRTDPTPYSVWVSEIMLQQTVVKAVVPHYQKWMLTWPTVESLADASEQAVMRLWEGLGYYRRVRNLLLAARVVVERHNGHLPETYEQLVELPGIGDYTARAILSIAYGKAVTLIDANVRRVLQRLGAWREWDASSRREGRDLSERMMVRARPGDFNQAFMELGQQVCKRKNPTCPACPLAETCRAHAGGLQSEIPAPRKGATVHRVSRVLIVLCDDQVWLSRPAHKLLGGLWTFPRVRRDRDIPGSPEARLTARTHSYTRYRERLYPEIHRLTERFSEGPLGLADGRWTPMADLDNLPFPSVYRRIAGDLERYLDTGDPA